VPTPSILLGSRIVLRGAGASSVIKRNPGGNARPLIRNKGRTKGTRGTGKGDDGIVISDLSLDGNKGSTKSYASNEQGIWLAPVRDSIIDRVWVYDQCKNEIALEYCKGVSVTRCIARDNLKNGFYLTGSDRITLSACIGHGNRVCSYAVACSWFCALSGRIGWGDVGASLGTGRDTQYLSVSGGRYEGAEVSAKLVNGPVPGTTERPAPAGPYDGTTGYGTSHSLFAGLVIHAPLLRHFGLRFIGGSGNLIANCSIRDVRLSGIMLFGSARNTVRGNIISNVGKAGDPSKQDAGEDQLLGGGLPGGDEVVQGLAFVGGQGGHGLLQVVSPDAIIAPGEPIPPQTSTHQWRTTRMEKES
jgi:parallel beta-helix repeat protein